jgi:hypothetical protein
MLLTRDEIDNSTIAVRDDYSATKSGGWIRVFDLAGGEIKRRADAKPARP